MLPHPGKCKGTAGNPRLPPTIREASWASECPAITFLLRNSLTREAATSSTYKLSMLLALPPQVTRPLAAPGRVIRWAQ